MVSQCFRVLSLWGAQPCLCEAGPSNWYTHMFLHHLCPRLSRASVCFCYCSIVNWPIAPNPPLAMASFILLEGGLGSSRWRVWRQRCRLAMGGYPSKEKPLPLGPSPLALGPPLPPNCQCIQLPALVQAQGTAPPPWLPFPIWKPKSPLQLGSCESLVNATGLVGRSGFWPPVAWRVGEDACAVPLFVICKQTAETSV